MRGLHGISISTCVEALVSPLPSLRLPIVRARVTTPPLPTFYSPPPPDAGRRFRTILKSLGPAIRFQLRKFPQGGRDPSPTQSQPHHPPMNKGSVATASNSVKSPTTSKGAWLKGPPQTQTPLPGQTQPPPPAGPSSNTSRSNTPNQSAAGTPAHSRRPSAYAPAVAVKGGQPRPSEFFSLQSDWEIESGP